MKRPSSDALEPIVWTLCQRINSPRSLSVWLCFKYNQDALLELPSADSADRDPYDFLLDYFITEYLSKYKGLKTSFDKPGNALRKWKLSEQRCAQTNLKFREYRLRPFSGRVEAALFRAQRKIAAVLGQLRLPVVLSDCMWGPGATFDLKRSDASPDKKMLQAISVTASALGFMRSQLESDPDWFEALYGVKPEGPYSMTSANFKLVRGSRFLTVPKSSKTDRCIAAEPTGNSFLQQGVHHYMRRRLRRFGVDLDDQSINQEGARAAYTSGLSTLDLSAASDSISRELVFHLLPLDWALFLDSIRSPETRVNGHWIRTEKFASMGNAFCFELETLIFWALASSVDENFGSVDSVTVYGDDIIVPRNSFESVVEILTFCGFEVNEKKSFADGNFYESCGKHYYKSIDVTPVYQKEVLSHPSEVIRAHNRIYRLASQRLPKEKWFIVRKALREMYRLYPHSPIPKIPEGVDEDGGFLCPVEDLPPPDPNRGFRCRVLDYVPRSIEVHEGAMYAYKLRRASRLKLSRHHGNCFLQDDAFNFNPSKKGWPGYETKGKWRSRERWIPVSAIGVI